MTASGTPSWVTFEKIQIGSCWFVLLFVNCMCCLLCMLPLRGRFTRSAIALFVIICRGQNIVNSIFLLFATDIVVSAGCFCILGILGIICSHTNYSWNATLDVRFFTISIPCPMASGSPWQLTRSRNKICSPQSSFSPAQACMLYGTLQIKTSTLMLLTQQREHLWDLR